MHEIIFLVDLDADVAIYTWRGFRDNAQGAAHSTERRHARLTFDHGVHRVLKGARARARDFSFPPEIGTPPNWVRAAVGNR